MESIKDFFEENKKFVIIAACVVVALIVSSVIYNIFTSAPQTEEQKQTFIQGEFTLPKKDTVNKEESPLMYDFLAGTLGLNEDYVDMVGGWQFVFATKEGSSKIYFAYKQGNEGTDSIKLFLPRFSSEPLQYYLKSEEEMNNFFSQLDKNEGEAVEKVKEGEYTFYIIKKIEKLEGFNAVDIDWMKNNSVQGDESKAIDAGQGYPTNIIREKCDLEKIKEVSGVDFNDKFWDTVNYNAKIKCFNVQDRSKYIVLSPVRQSVVAGEDMVYSFSVNGTVLPMDKETLSDYLEKAGYESIDTALTNHSYANQTEISNATELK